MVWITYKVLYYATLWWHNHEQRHFKPLCRVIKCWKCKPSASEKKKFFSFSLNQRAIFYTVVLPRKCRSVNITLLQGSNTCKIIKVENISINVVKGYVSYMDTKKRTLHGYMDTKKRMLHDVKHMVNPLFISYPTLTGN